MRIFPALVIMTMLCNAEVRTSRFHNRAAWTIDTPQLRVTVLEWGAHVGEIVLKDADAVNPLWIQALATIEPDQYVPAKHESMYGGDSAARLLSGLMGHSLCFPFWGNPSDAEYAAGMTYHGETGIARWTRVAGGPSELILSAQLPESGTRFTRTLRVAGQVLWFDETAANEKAWDRPVGWCEHVTLGPPFLERGATVVDASATRGEAYGHEFSWPMGADPNGPVDLRHVRALGPVLVNHFLVAPGREWGFFAAFHPGKRLLFGYAFPRADFPWLNVWEANDPAMLTRGMEFSNTPVHGTMKALVGTPQKFGAPAFEWLDAKGKLQKRFCAFSVRVPENFRGVEDIVVHGEELIIVEKGTGRKVPVR